MKLLFITRTVDPTHPLAGFAASWVREFGNQLSLINDHVSVIAWQEGREEGSPENVAVHSAAGTGRIGHIRLVRLIRFIGLLAKLVPRSGAVFVHQHPLYAIIAAPFAKLFRKKMFLWYVHTHVDFKLKLAAALCDGIFTASKESFQLKTGKPVYVVGHGIDTSRFSPSGAQAPNARFTVVSVGRLSPIKGYEVLIDAAQLMSRHATILVRIVGGAGLSSQAAYVSQLMQRVRERGLERVVILAGPKAHEGILEEYRNADVCVNLSDTGSLDKAPLEAMACGVPVVTSNSAFRTVLSPIDEHLWVQKTPDAVAKALERIMRMPAEARRQLGEKLRAVVVRDHNLVSCVGRILTIMKQPI